MVVFVDTSVWSLALRRDTIPNIPEVHFLRGYLERGEIIVTTGLVLQELLQGFNGPKHRQSIVERFSALPAVYPDRRDHVEAATLRNRCRNRGIQLGTIDAVLIQLCMRHGMTMLTTDKDFLLSARETKLAVWQDSGS
jgi:predicted nucleic acid-binding protein